MRMAKLNSKTRNCANQAKRAPIFNHTLRGYNAVGICLGRLGSRPKKAEGADWTNSGCVLPPLSVWGLQTKWCQGHCVAFRLVPPLTACITGDWRLKGCLTRLERGSRCNRGALAPHLPREKSRVRSNKRAWRIAGMS